MAGIPCSDDVVESLFLLDAGALAPASTRSWTTPRWPFRSEKEERNVSHDVIYI